MSYFDEKDPLMEQYLELHTSKEPETLRLLRKETHQKTTQPHMLSGYIQGRALSLISKMLRPKKILEIGTFTGYATLCLAEGLHPQGKLVTLDTNEELAWLPKKYLKEHTQIDFQIKNALDFLKQNPQHWDLVFIDADKENYPEYLHLLLPHLDSGAVLLFDNVLWYGKVLDPNPKAKSTLAIQKLNREITQNPDLENVILPLRDGLHIVRKI